MALNSSLTALTREKFMPILVDNIFNSSVLCYKLLKNADMLDGGSKIVVPIEYAENNSSNGGWLLHNGGNSVSNDAVFQAGAKTGQQTTSVFTKSEWDWATGYQSIIVPGEEPLMNKGDAGVLSVLKARLSNAEKTFKDTIGTALFAANPATTPGSITSLNGAGVYDGGQTSTQAKVWDQNDDAGKANHAYINDYSSLSGAAVYYLPESGINSTIVGFDREVGGIDTDATTGATNPYWNANVDSAVWSIGTVESASSTTALNLAGTNDFANISFDKACQTVSGVANLVKAFTKMYGACTIDQDMPDMIVTTQVIYDAFSNCLESNKRFEGNAEIAQAGFMGLRFRNATVVVDSHVPSGHAYFLNSKYLDFKVHKDANFKLDDFKSMEVNYGLQARIFWMGQLVCSAPRMQGLLVGLPTGY